jgi:hypothetical protein
MGEHGSHVDGVRSVPYGSYVKNMCREYYASQVQCIMQKIELDHTISELIYILFYQISQITPN